QGRCNRPHAGGLYWRYEARRDGLSFRCYRCLPEFMRASDVHPIPHNAAIKPRVAPSVAAFLPASTKRDVRHTLALVLAGGRGARLMGLTDWRVKPAVHFGGKFRIIDFALSNCINSDIRRIGVLTQYKSQSLIRHIMSG